MTFKKILVCLFLLASIFSLAVCTNEEQEDAEFLSPEETAGSSALKGTWHVGAVRSDGKLIDVQDNKTLANMFLEHSLTFKEDGSFLYSPSTLNIYEGECSDHRQVADKEYLLESSALLVFDSTKDEFVAKSEDVQSLPIYVVKSLDEGKTLELNEYDSTTGTAKEDSLTLIFIQGQSSEYILDNKARVSEQKNGSNESEYTTPEAKSPVSASKKRALQRALDYLDYTAFSYEGLIKQLECEGFAKTEAADAADNCGANWNTQAERKARDYLDLMDFSYSRLVDQLEFDGFTHSQAEYGASRAY